MKEQLSNFFKIGSWITVLLFAIRCGLSWKNLFVDFSLYDLFGYAGEAIGISAIVMFFYERFLWKYAPWEKMPRLKKEYSVVIISEYDKAEHKAKAIIHQTLLSLSIRLITNESSSKSCNVTLTEKDNEWNLTYTYINTPNNSVRYRSEMHYGTVILENISCDGLSGRYFTDRLTRGDLVFAPYNKNS